MLSLNTDSLSLKQNDRWGLEKFIFYLPLFLLVLEVMQGYVSIPGIGTLRALIVAACAITYYVRKPEKIGSYSAVWLFLFYVFISVLRSTRYSEAFQNYIRVFDSLIMLPLAYEACKDGRDLKYFFDGIVLMGIVFMLNGIICATFKIGTNPYGGSFVMGSIVINKLYSGSYFIILFPLILFFRRYNRFVIPLFVVTGIIFIELVLMLRRTAIALPLIGLCVMFVFTQRKAKFILTLVVGVTLAFLAYPLYGDILMDSMANREHVFGEHANSIEEEGRYIESVAVTTERLGNDVSYWTFLFGKEALNSKGNYYHGLLGHRPIHLDYNKLIHGLGLIGTLLYLLIYIQIILKFIIAYRNAKKTPIVVELHGMFWAILLTSLAVSSIGGFYELTFRTIIFMFLGLAIKVVETQRISNI
ncbi:hypothetical protein [Carboxylicivirga taeanensis]|uniref:hypothetical protein n=1 Tax=Carboxylicivirga taeanensis TaxID=1416875 RepID=UPI003F6E0851